MSPVPPIKRPRLNNRSRGQVMVIFVAAILTFVGLCAIVVDVSWYWANTLRAQRAADAAALAGAVYLPVDSGSAFAEAQKAAVRNGYTNGVGGVKVIPFVDADDPRQLDVRVEGHGPVVLRAGLRNQGMAGLAHRRGRLHPARPDGQPGRLLRRRRLLDERDDHEHLVAERHHEPAGAGRQRADRRDWSFNGGRGRTITTVVEGNDNDFAFTNTTEREAAMDELRPSDQWRLARPEPRGEPDRSPSTASRSTSMTSS